MKGITQKLRAVMFDLPGTVDELATELKAYSRRAVQVGMWILTYNKQAVSRYDVLAPDDAPRGRKTRKVYELTPYGVRLYRRDCRRKAV